jgi:antitoxin ParD1/3/4
VPTRNVVLTEQQGVMIERLVYSGRYQNASEVLRDGLRLVQQREAEDKAGLAALRQAASVGLHDFTAGRFRSFADRKALCSHLAARADKVLSRSSADLVNHVNAPKHQHIGPPAGDADRFGAKAMQER